MPFSRGSSDPGMEPGAPALQADSPLPSEPQEKDGYFLSGISFHIIFSGRKSTFISRRTSPGLLVGVQVLWRLWRKRSSCSPSKHSSVETPGSASKPSLCPGLESEMPPAVFLGAGTSVPWLSSCLGGPACGPSPPAPNPS